MIRASVVLTASLSLCAGVAAAEWLGGALLAMAEVGADDHVIDLCAGDEIEGQIGLSGDSGPGWGARGAVSGPVGNSKTLKFPAAVSYLDTDGIMTPRTSLFVDPTDPSPQLSLLVDTQDNFASAVFGAPELKAVRVSVNTDAPRVFGFEPL